MTAIGQAAGPGASDGLPSLASDRPWRAWAHISGALIDVTAAAQGAGFRWPTAISAEAWAHCVGWGHDPGRQAEADRLRDVLCAARNAVLHARDGAAARVGFTAYAVPGPGRPLHPYRLALAVGPSGGGLVVTILLASEPGDDPPTSGP